MSEAADQDDHSPSDSDDRHDPLLTLFILGVVLLLLLCAVLMLIANSRPPAGL
jgi:hypothetical protein